MFDIRDIETRVADSLNVNKARLLINCRFCRREVIYLHIARMDVARLGQNHIKLGVSSAIEVRSRDKLIARGGDIQDCEVDRRRARRDRDSRRATLKCRETLLQDIFRRVHQSRIDVRRLLQCKAVRTILCVLKVIRRRTVDGHRAGVRRRVAVPTRVNRECLGMQFLYCVAHVIDSF